MLQSAYDLRKRVEFTNGFILWKITRELVRF